MTTYAVTTIGDVADASPAPPRISWAAAGLALVAVVVIAKALERPRAKNPYVGFRELESELREKGARDPRALAASIGRKKYGPKKFARMARRRRRNPTGLETFVFAAAAIVALAYLPRLLR